MAGSVWKAVHFSSKAVPDDTLLVAKLDGHEQISKPYRFELELLSRDANVDFRKVLQEPAWIGIEQGASAGAAEPLKIHGRIATFEQIEVTPAGVRYRAVIVPRIWKLSLSYQSRIFQKLTVPKIIEQILREAGFASDAFEFKTTRTYPEREYVVQYEETDLDFVSRWLEHEGIWFVFEQGATGEKIVFADASVHYLKPSGKDSVPFRAEGRGIEWDVNGRAAQEESIHTLACSQALIAKQVILKDYNWRTPGVDLRCTTEVSPDGEGTVFEYNNHYRTPEEGKTLAKIRAEEIRARERVLRGAGSCRAFRAGACSTTRRWTSRC